MHLLKSKFWAIFLAIALCCSSALGGDAVPTPAPPPAPKSVVATPPPGQPVDGELEPAPVEELDLFELFEIFLQMYLL
jgi:hypothetical protein